MRTFNDFEVIREELARRQAEANALAAQTGNYSPNVVQMSGMINMAEVRNAQERLADRLDRRRVEAGSKLIRLSSVDNRDLRRRQLLAQMLADDLKPRNYDPEGLGEEDVDFEGGTDLFDELVSQMERGDLRPKRDRGVLEDIDAEFEGPSDRDPLDMDEEGDEYTDDIERILAEGRGSRGL